MNCVCIVILTLLSLVKADESDSWPSAPHDGVDSEEERCFADWVETVRQAETVVMNECATLHSRMPAGRAMGTGQLAELVRDLRACNPVKHAALDKQRVCALSSEIITLFGSLLDMDFEL